MPVLAIAFWFFVLLDWLTAFKMWRESEDHWSYQKLPWFHSDRWWRAYRRSTLPGAMWLSSIAFGLTAEWTTAWLLPVSLIALLVVSPLVVSTAVFNRPKVLVPPRPRTEAPLWRDKPGAE
jgi:hypothetical protein